MKYALFVCQVGSLVLLLAGGAGMAGDDTQDDDLFAKLKGEWVAVSFIADGRPAPAELVPTLRWTFQDPKTLLVHPTAQSEKDVCPLKIFSYTNPIAFEFTPPANKLRSAKSGDPKTKPVVMGILKFDNDKLVVNLCRRARTAERPKKFESKAGSETLLLTFARPRPEKDRPAVKDK